MGNSLDADPYRPRVTHQNIVDEVSRSVAHMQREVGEDLAPVLSEIADDVARLLAEDAWFMPTRLQRLGLWLARCPAVPWRRYRSVLHDHGLVTGWIVALGRWLGP